MKVVILGASGMLGAMLVKVLSQSFDIVATVRNKDFIKPTPGVSWRTFDAGECNMPALEKLLEDASWVINAIGVIPQRYTGNEAGRVCKIAHQVLPLELALVASKKNTRVIQIATDCVFSGGKGNYTEDSEHDPLNVPKDHTYALTKHLGEIKSSVTHHIRCSLVGPEYHGKSLLGWFLSQPQGTSIPGFTNHQWNGVTTLAFAQVCQGIIESGVELPHCQHLVPADTASKAELLDHFREYFRPDITIKAWPSPIAVDRTLATDNPELNRRLWSLAGFPVVPTIRDMVRELARCGK